MKKTRLTKTLCALLSAVLLLSSCGVGKESFEPEPSPAPLPISDPESKPEPGSEPEPYTEPEPSLLPEGFSGETVGEGCKLLMQSGSARFVNFVRIGDELVTVEDGGETVYLRSYSLASGELLTEHILPVRFPGMLFPIDGGGVGHFSGTELHYLTAMRADELSVFTDPSNPAAGYHEYEFYSDGLFLRYEDSGVVIGSFLNGTYERVSFDLGFAYEYFKVAYREGDLIAFRFGSYTGERCFAYDLSSKALFELTDYDPDFRTRCGGVAVRDNGNGTLTVRRGGTPDTEISLYRRGETLWGVSENYVVTVLSTGEPVICTVYSLDGTPLFRGELPGEGSLGYMLYDDGGFFFTKTTYGSITGYKSEDVSSIYYLDLSETTPPEPPHRDPALTAAIKPIEEKYPVSVVYGEDAVVIGRGFSADVAEGGEEVLNTVEMIADFLDKFPEGFISEMYSYTGMFNPTHLTFCLTGQLYALGESGTSNPAAFAFRESDEQYIVIDVTQIYSLEQNLAHEMMHAIDTYLSAINFDEVYPEWDSYLPEGFSYNGGYRDADGNDYFNTDYTIVSGQPIWFVDVYSKTLAIEDRAVMFSAMFTGVKGAFWTTERHVTDRMGYLASVIRKNFRCLDGAEKTIWERFVK